MEEPKQNVRLELIWEEFDKLKKVSECSVG